MFFYYSSRIREELYSNLEYVDLRLDDRIVLDENGEDYVLTFCCLDIGGGPNDCISDYSYLLKVSDWQLEIIKTLVVEDNLEKIPYGAKYDSKGSIGKGKQVCEKLKYTFMPISKTLVDDMGIKKEFFEDEEYGWDYNKVFVFLNKL